jgi:hypothetical protein
MEEDFEVKYWSHHLGVSREELQKVVGKVGNSVAAVRAKKSESSSSVGIAPTNRLSFCPIRFHYPAMLQIDLCPKCGSKMATIFLKKGRIDFRGRCEEPFLVPAKEPKPNPPNSTAAS